MGHVDARVAPVCTQDGGVQAVGSRAPFSSWPSSGSRHSPATRQVWVPERRVRPDGPFSSTVAITPTTLTGDCTRSGPPVRPGMPTLRQYPSNKREPKDSGVPRDNRIISRAENQGKNDVEKNCYYKYNEPSGDFSLPPAEHPSHGTGTLSHSPLSYPRRRVFATHASLHRHCSSGVNGKSGFR